MKMTNGRIATVQISKGLADEDDAVGVPVWQRIQQHCIHDAEHRGCQPDAERQGQNGDHREAWIPPKSPNGVPAVPKEVFNKRKTPVLAIVRRMVEYLHLRGPSQVGTLARELGEQVGSISHHLRMLERADIVARAPELATDGRTSWWRLEQTTISWSVDDFADDAASRHQAQAAERLNLEHQLSRLAQWKRMSERADPAWRRAAFSSDFVALASAAELAALAAALDRTVREWRDGLSGAPDASDEERSPVFVFAHGFPTQT